MKKQILIQDTFIVQDINKDKKVFEKGKILEIRIEWWFEK